MQGQEKSKMYNLKRKRTQGNFLLEPRFVLKETGEKNGIKGVVPSGQDTTQLILKLVKGKSLRDFLCLKATALEILCKCKSRRQPGFSPSSLLNLAIWALWFWLKDLEGYRRKVIFLCS